MLLVVLIPLYVVISLAGDILVNHGEGTGPLPWLHVVALPAEVGVFVAMLVGMVAFIGYLFVGGVVTALEREDTDSDGDVAYHWRVEFTDEDSRLNTVGFVSHSFSRSPTVEGTVLQVRYRVVDPANVFAIRPGLGARVFHWVSGLVALGLWAFFVASIPVGLVVAGLVWLVRQV